MHYKDILIFLITKSSFVNAGESDQKKYSQSLKVNGVVLSHSRKSDNTHPIFGPYPNVIKLDTKSPITQARKWTVFPIYIVHPSKSRFSFKRHLAFDIDDPFAGGKGERHHPKNWDPSVKDNLKKMLFINCFNSIQLAETWASVDLIGFMWMKKKFRSRTRESRILEQGTLALNVIWQTNSVTCQTKLLKKKGKNNCKALTSDWSLIVNKD